MNAGFPEASVPVTVRGAPLVFVLLVHPDIVVFRLQFVALDEAQSAVERGA